MTGNRWSRVTAEPGGSLTAARPPGNWPVKENWKNLVPHNCVGPEPNPDPGPGRIRIDARIPRISICNYPSAEKCRAWRLKLEWEPNWVNFLFKNQIFQLNVKNFQSPSQTRQLLPYRTGRSISQHNYFHIKWVGQNHSRNQYLIIFLTYQIQQNEVDSTTCPFQRELKFYLNKHLKIFAVRENRTQAACVYPGLSKRSKRKPSGQHIPLNVYLSYIYIYKFCTTSQRCVFKW